MKTILSLVVVCLLAQTSIAQTLVVAYVPNWIDLKSYAREIDYDRLTHINIAFENPKSPLGEMSYRRDNDVLIAAAHKKGVKVLVSIGGGAASGNEPLKERYFDLISDEKRADFCQLLVGYVEQHDLDGIDVDLEGPAINQDYGKFIAELAGQLKPRGKFLTAALSQGFGGKSVPDECWRNFDFINVMAYDNAGPWAPESPGQHSSLAAAKRQIEYWRAKRNVPAEKLVLGVPFYGRGFGKDFSNTAETYERIVAKHPGAEKQDQVGETIWYNGIPTIQAKTQYVLDEGLRGVMIWSLNQDAKGEKSLLKAIDDTIQADRN
ncbi:glycosyl hydrolase family 18 protein [Blastopirellula marina]|uniref:chitinase n=1 Tax=Blastopirellula marina TaxID=124 RepID=A0A2S8F397_9BACT|nr:glycosyl hydrolase family 18 protein [Blastopirellula marina]PQO26638.1 glycoside hydrolase [Blastopirellula marina]PTL40949.1 glycoside hydrolase [Blastopirellula marina]